MVDPSSVASSASGFKQARAVPHNALLYHSVFPLVVVPCHPVVLELGEAGRWTWPGQLTAGASSPVAKSTREVLPLCCGRGIPLRAPFPGKGGPNSHVGRHRDPDGRYPNLDMMQFSCDRELKVNGRKLSLSAGTPLVHISWPTGPPGVVIFRDYVASLAAAESKVELHAGASTARR